MSSHIDAGAVSEGIGARLKSGRERAGLSLIEVAEKLHVDPHAIEALEAERFEEFGASVYVRGHLRHYAELIGESPLELQELYATSAHVVRAPDLTRLPITQGGGPSRTALVPGMAVVVAVALVGSAWWVAGNLEGSSSERAAAPLMSRAASNGTGASPAATAAPSNVPAAAHQGGPAAHGAGAGAGVPSGTATLPVAAAAGALAARLAVSSPARGSIAAEPAQLPPGAEAGVSLPRRSSAAHPRVSELQLHFSEDSWAEVYDARGERLLFDVGSADSTRTVSGAPPLRVVLGNPLGVALELDGRPVSVPDGAARNVSIEFRINRSGRVAPSRLAAAEARNEERKSGRD